MTWRTLTTAIMALAISVALTPGSGVHAEDMKSRASSAISGANTDGAIFTGTRRDTTLAPFAGQTPPEASIPPAALESQGYARTLTNTDEARIYNYSIARTPLELEPNSPLFDDGRWATAVGPIVLGDIESGAARSCTYRDFGDIPPITRECERVQNFTEESCTTSLLISAGLDSEDASACASYDATPTCYPAAKTCIEPAETRVVNGQSETRLCWGWRVDYICEAPGTIGNCTRFETSAACTQTKSTCLSPDGAGGCDHELAEFTCGNPDAVFDPACASVQVCTGDLCDGVPVTASPDFSKAAMHLNLANEATGETHLFDLTCTESEDGVGCTSASLRFFDGTRRTCKIRAFGLDNCCTGGGLLSGFFGGCSFSELEIHHAAEAGRLVSLGSYCSNRSFFGFCRTRKRAFCIYETRMARVFNTEVRATTGVSFGSAKRADCRGVTINQLQGVDLATLDLSAAFPDFPETASGPDAGLLEARLKEGINRTLTRVAGTDTPTGEPDGDTAGETSGDTLTEPAPTLGEIAGTTTEENPYVADPPPGYSTGVPTLDGNGPVSIPLSDTELDVGDVLPPPPPESDNNYDDGRGYNDSN